MILIRSFHRTKHSPCVALVLIAHPVVPVFAQVVAGIVAQVAVVPAAIVVVVVAMAHVVADVMVPAQVDVLLLVVPLVGVTDVRVTVLRLAGWIALVDAAVDAALHVDVVVVLAVVLHVEMALGLLKFV